jgi:hypothetical protein
MSKVNVLDESEKTIEQPQHKSLILFIKSNKFQSWFKTFKFIAIRVICVGFLAFSTTFMICYSKNNLFILELISAVLIIAETLYITLARKGKDFKWFVYTVG